eukprot:TRINITY_DN6553_c2_g5_i1.p1 TRINITY_DN6553_c2_g5~~TRINITY_DN6553_c2_g5_i1.p1  ORF type:complete len:942 (-),score=160.65 TRINITY_DN6553_c2_g5_i1:204-2996(-)
MAQTMGIYGNVDTLTHDVVEDRSSRRRQGLPSKYSRGRFLGKGGFAKCYEVLDTHTGESFAAKIVSKASVSRPRAHAKLRSEIAIHRSLDNCKVVKFYDYFEDSENVYIILELCPGQTLNEFMKRRPNKCLTEPEAMFYVYELIVALKYLHQHRVIHRDLKLGNLFLDKEGCLKVGDFGLAAQLESDGEKKRTICGTPNYIAPEILEGRHGHSYEVDIWSLGVILYTMVFGRPPFETTDVKLTYRRIRYNQYTFPDNVRCSTHVKDLVCSILRTDPLARPSLDQILASPWLQSYDSRLPPPMPASIAASASSFAVPVNAATPRSDRPHGGGSSVRGETPDRGGADFARIDSPAARGPLSDRSPSVGPPGQYTPSAPLHLQHSPQHGSVHAQPQPYAQPRPLASSPLMAGAHKQQQVPLGEHGGGGGCGSARGAGGGLPSGRPPLSSHRGNEENVAPNAHYGSEAKLAKPVSAHCIASPIGSAAAPPGGRNTQGGATPVPVATPLSRHGSASRLAQACTARSASSPRQQAPSGGSSTRAGSASNTPRDLGGTSANADGSYGTFFAKTVPSPSPHRGLASSGSTASARRLGLDASGASGGGAQVPVTVVSLSRPQSHAAQGQQHQQVAQPQPRRATERSSSSPALIFEAPQRRDTPDVAAGTAASPRRRDGAGSSRGPRQGSGHDFVAPVPPSLAAYGGGSARGCGAAASQSPAELWVVKWVDYSSKYGIGYVLSDGCIGVYFNDSTKIVQAADGCFDYVTRRTQDRNEVRSTHPLEGFPEDLTKKVTLLKHFRNYMLANVTDRKDGAAVGESSLPGSQASPCVDSSRAQYVRKWTRNKHALLFQLSNRIVQVVFFDRTEAVLSSKTQTVTYVDKRGVVSTYPLSNGLEVPNQELAKRLRYIKDILVNLLGARNVDFGAPSAAAAPAVVAAA